MIMTIAFFLFASSIPQTYRVGTDRLQQFYYKKILQLVGTLLGNQSCFIKPELIINFSH
jgi:hypothetical protein